MAPRPKNNRRVDQHKTSNSNTCQTPDYALDPLLPFLPKAGTIWEPAAGEGYLANALQKAGFKVIASDILDGRNFFSFRPIDEFDVLVTNPPYNPKEIKPAWIERCYQLGKPWANLLPVDTIGTGDIQAMFDQYGVEIIYLDKRVNFKMPHKGWSGKAQFSVAWFTHGLNIGKQITFAKIYRRVQGQMSLFEYAETQPSLFDEKRAA